MRGAGEDCFSGECGHCLIEIEAIVGKQGGKPTTEVYPMGPDVIDIPHDTFEDYFPFSKKDENDGT